MGRLDQYAKEIFAEETPAITRGGAVWQPPAEISLTEVRLDGCLLVRDRTRLLGLPAPWSEARRHDEIVVDVKMQGDHLDMYALERGLLRRQARQVQRMGDPKTPWDGDLPFWMITSHVPAVVNQRRTVRQVAPGCYRIEPSAFPFLWVAANELPLTEELIPFLITRTGRALDELGRWVQNRRPPGWLLRMIEFLPMSTAVYEELFRFLATKTEDPEVQARQKLLGKLWVDIMLPEVKAELNAEIRVADARSALRRVLARRKLALSAADEARINACTDLPTLERWHEQAVEAQSAAEALQ